jgi:MFS family permease
VGATYGTIATLPRDSEELSQFIDSEGWRPQHYLIVFYVAAVKAFCGCTVGSFPFILIELEKEFNVGRAQVASAAGCLLFGSIIGAYIGGNMSDAAGRRTTLLFAATVGSFLSLLHLLVTQLWHLCCVRFLLGITFGNIVSCMNVYLIEFMPSSTRGWCICIAGLGWKVGAIYGVVLAWVIEDNWRLVLSGGTVPGLLAAAVFFFLCPREPSMALLERRGHGGGTGLAENLCERKSA